MESFVIMMLKRKETKNLTVQVGAGGGTRMSAPAAASSKLLSMLRLLLKV